MGHDLDVTIIVNITGDFTKDGLSDAILTLNLKGTPNKATFRKPDRVFYESAVMRGTATLSMKSFSWKEN